MAVRKRTRTGLRVTPRDAVVTECSRCHHTKDLCGEGYCWSCLEELVGESN